MNNCIFKIYHSLRGDIIKRINAKTDDKVYRHIYFDFCLDCVSKLGRGSFGGGISSYPSFVYGLDENLLINFMLNKL